MNQSPDPKTLDQRVHRTIVTDIVSVTLPLVAGFAIAFVIGGLLAGQPRRALPGALLGLFSFVAWTLVRRDRLELGAKVFVAGTIIAPVLAMLFNGGLLAPGMVRLIGTVVLVGWVVGIRGATWAAIGASVLVLVFALLDEWQVLPAAVPATPLLRALTAVFAVWLAWAGTAVPQRTLRNALFDSLLREQALREAEDRRRRSELAFEAIFEQAGQLMLLVEAGGVVIRANRAAAEAFAPKLVTGASVLDSATWPPEALARLARALEQAGSSATPVQLQLADARGRSFDLTLSAVQDAEETSRRVVVQGRDISALLEDKDREARSRRLALVGQLAGGVAHDFNNVLAVTLTSVDALREDLAQAGHLSPQLGEHLDDIASVTQRAADLTRRLLTFGRKAPLLRKVRSMHELVRATLSLLTRTLPANIALKQELHAARDLVDVDAASFESVLLNLAINARDAMPNGGSLTVASDVIDLDEAACRTGEFELRPGPHLRITVTDTGTGIAPEVIGRVFEPFFTTKPEGKGSGIGLASVLGAMQEHGGAVQVESEQGRGTRFQLLFPLTTAVPAPAPARPMETNLAGLTALVVDDEPQLRALLTRQLKRLGVSVVSAPDAETGLAEFQKAPAQFDFAVLDVVLPGRSGSELAKELIATTPIKVLLISGYPRDADLTSLPPERVTLLGKPFSGEALKVALTQLLTR